MDKLPNLLNPIHAFLAYMPRISPTYMQAALSQIAEWE